MQKENPKNAGHLLFIRKGVSGEIPEVFWYSLCISFVLRQNRIAMGDLHYFFPDKREHTPYFTLTNKLLFKMEEETTL